MYVCVPVRACIKLLSHRVFLLIIVVHGEHLNSLVVETQGPAIGKFGSGLKSAVLAGFLNEFVDDRINMVNAIPKATDLQIQVSDVHTSTSSIYNNAIKITFTTDGNVSEFTGTVYGSSGRIVQIGNRELFPCSSSLFVRDSEIYCSPYNICIIS